MKILGIKTFSSTEKSHSREKALGFTEGEDIKNKK